MSKFDPTKDKCLKEWSTGKEDKDLIVGVYSYNVGPPKLGFKRWVKKYGTEKMIKVGAGRLTWDDCQFLFSIQNEIEDAMSK